MVRYFEILPHTADLRIIAQGSTLDNLFFAALEGLCELISPGSTKARQKHDENLTISLSGDDNTLLLIDFLNKSLTAMHNRKAVFPVAWFRKLDKTGLVAELEGFRVDEFEDDVKAVTYHEANIISTPEGVYQTIIIPDI